MCMLTSTHRRQPVDAPWYFHPARWWVLEPVFGWVASPIEAHSQANPVDAESRLTTQRCPTPGFEPASLRSDKASSCPTELPEKHNETNSRRDEPRCPKHQPPSHLRPCHQSTPDRHPYPAIPGGTPTVNAAGIGEGCSGRNDGRTKLRRCGWRPYDHEAHQCVAKKRTRSLPLLNTHRVACAGLDRCCRPPLLPPPLTCASLRRS